MNNRKLVLENGIVFEGVGFGSMKEALADVIYNTSVVGYQEIISDPANCNKIICMTYPLIGNYGMTDEDYESKYISAKGMVVREYNDFPSNFRYTRTLAEVMDENNISGIADIDTRALTKIIRDKGSMKALLCDIDKPLDECLKQIADYKEQNLVSLVSSKKIWFSRTANPKYSVAVIDLGTKLNFIKKLNAKGCNVIIFPYNATKEEIMKYKPNGLFISSGPGSPDDLAGVVEVVKSFIGEIPIFATCLGHLIVGKAYGASVVKMKIGHHGSNYPVKNLVTGKVEITSQNHLYTLDKKSIEATPLKVTHQNVINNEIEGVIDEANSVMSIQFEPITPIDENTEDAISEFISLMKNFGGKNNA